MFSSFSIIPTYARTFVLQVCMHAVPFAKQMILYCLYARQFGIAFAQSNLNLFLIHIMYVCIFDMHEHCELLLYSVPPACLILIAFNDTNALDHCMDYDLRANIAWHCKFLRHALHDIHDEK